MARTVIYRYKSQTVQQLQEDVYGPDKKYVEGGLQVIVQPKIQEEEIHPGDPYVDRLTKFIPAEIIAFFAPLAALVAGRTSLLIAAGVIGLLATPAYLWITARKLEEQQKPRLHFYFLSSIAFIAWALATSELGKIFGLDAIATSFMLGVTVFLIPLLDLLFTPSLKKGGGK